MLNIFGIFFVIRKIFVVEPYWLRIEKTIKPSDHTKSTKRHKTNCHSGKIRGDVLYTLDVGGRVFYIMYATARCYKWVLRQRQDWKGEWALEGGTWSPLWTWGPLGGRGGTKVGESLTVVLRFLARWQKWFSSYPSRSWQRKKDIKYLRGGNVWASASSTLYSLLACLLACLLAYVRFCKEQFWGK